MKYTKRRLIESTAHGCRNRGGAVCPGEEQARLRPGSVRRAPDRRQRLHLRAEFARRPLQLPVGGRVGVGVGLIKTHRVILGLWRTLISLR
jgi:hypothetical protein